MEIWVDFQIIKMLSLIFYSDEQRDIRWMEDFRKEKIERFNKGECLIVV
jgi:hypothetical protein